MNGTILDNPAGLSWSSTAQFSLNRNKIKELYEGVNLYDIKTFDAIQIVAPVGGYYGEIYGQTFMRVTDENSPHYGKIVVGDDGLPLISTEKSKVGNQSPDWMMGWTNNFSYKGFNLSFLIDFRIGGSIYSATASNLYTRGNAAGTVVIVPNSWYRIPWFNRAVVMRRIRSPSLPRTIGSVLGLPEIMVYQRFIPIAPPMSVCVISPLATSSIDRC